MFLIWNTCLWLMKIRNWCHLQLFCAKTAFALQLSLQPLPSGPLKHLWILTGKGQQVVYIPVQLRSWSRDHSLCKSTAGNIRFKSLHPNHSVYQSIINNYYCREERLALGGSWKHLHTINNQVFNIVSSEIL